MFRIKLLKVRGEFFDAIEGIRTQY